MSTSVMGAEDAFLRDVVANPGDDSLYLILADWLEEYGDPRRAELLRLQRRLVATCCAAGEYPERAAWQARMVSLLAEGVRPSVPRMEVAGMTFVWCPPGSFLMGSPASEAERDGDETQHLVTLTQGFWMGATVVTQTQWQAVMGSNPSHFKGEDRPVETVSWEDCQTFCAKLKERTGKAFRLPTEAEWEYACRAGTTTPFFFGAIITPDQVNYDGNYPHGGAPKGVYRQRTTAVGGFPANAWGLFDMHGNVWEWCADWYGPYEEGTGSGPFPPACSAAAAGSTAAGTAGQRTATGTGRSAGSRTTGSGSSRSIDPVEEGTGSGPFPPACAAAAAGSTSAGAAGRRPAAGTSRTTGTGTTGSGSSRSIDPVEEGMGSGPFVPSTARVPRGGSWYNSGRDCRSANRSRDEPDNRNQGYGFRLALS